ncbi:hypothetical protein L208DRAFT_1376527 [Tricholoma matsutake]|nr:hypothetical protein L208DRAFT_1376527 [Tricholoma matsutake 945]
MPPHKAKKQPVSPEFIRDDSDESNGSDDYTGSMGSDMFGCDEDSKISDEDLEPSITIVTPLKCCTRGRATEPPVTPTPKKTPASPVQESPKKQWPNPGNSVNKTPSPQSKKGLPVKTSKPPSKSRGKKANSVDHNSSQGKRKTSNGVDKDGGIDKDDGVNEDDGVDKDDGISQTMIPFIWKIWT